MASQIGRSRGVNMHSVHVPRARHLFPVAGAPIGRSLSDVLGKWLGWVRGQPRTVQGRQVPAGGPSLIAVSTASRTESAIS
ncbi:hypothetical protein ACFFX0_12495 [Citricoccus parietis]|uniref:Alpha/beta hydrolase n=1 Tax=Citricoccus parietis TaxID=592307 RepID=A0ABV5FZA2_9MICC